MFRTIRLQKLSPASFGIFAAFAIGLSFGLAANGGPASAETDARTAYFERAAALSLDTRCNLLAPSAHSALAAATYQARGALLRAGVSPTDLASDTRSASKRAKNVDCYSKDAKTIATRINSSFAAWTTMLAMDFPGSYRTWQARRNPYDGWLVSQSLGADVKFGVKSLQDDTISGALEMPATMAIPSSARLVLRDPSRAPEFMADRLRDGGKSGLAAGLPPSGATRSFYASNRVAPVRATKYHPATGRIFCFPKEAVDALVSLDPREAAYVVLEYKNPAQNKTFLIEAGDLPAANAFVGARAS